MVAARQLTHHSIILDMDSSASPTHGEQEGSLAMCQPARSMSTTAWASGDTAADGRGGRVRWRRRAAWSAKRWRQVWRSVWPRVCMSANVSGNSRETASSDGDLNLQQNAPSDPPAAVEGSSICRVFTQPGSGAGQPFVSLRSRSENGHHDQLANRLGQFRGWSADQLAQRCLELSAASEFQCPHACGARPARPP
jgi:hypothetical protein